MKQQNYVQDAISALEEARKKLLSHAEETVKETLSQVAQVDKALKGLGVEQEPVTLGKTEKIVEAKPEKKAKTKAKRKKIGPPRPGSKRYKIIEQIRKFLTETELEKITARDLRMHLGLDKDYHMTSIIHPLIEEGLLERTKEVEHKPKGLGEQSKGHYGMYYKIKTPDAVERAIEQAETEPETAEAEAKDREFAVDVGEGTRWGRLKS